MSLVSGDMPIQPRRYTACADTRPGFQIVNDIIRLGRCEVSGALIDASRKFTVPWREDFKEIGLALIHASQFKKLPSLDEIRDRAHSLGFLTLSNTMALRFAEKYSLEDLNLEGLIFCCRSVQVPRANRPDKTRPHFIALQRSEKKDKLFLVRNGHGADYHYAPDATFAFGVPVL